MNSLCQKLKNRILGSGAVEKFLTRNLKRVYAAQFQSAWQHSNDAPHFYSQHWNVFRMLDGNSQGPGWLLRGVYAYEVIKHGDKVLDIGCGDGFFTRHFLAPRADHVDAVDIESSAIEEARYRNADKKISYTKSDAVTAKFPSERYDVVVWDGAIGHFARETSETVLIKIAAALSVGGIFCGSETLGTEGSDHLQYFKEPADLAALLSQAFQHVWMKIDSYPINNGFMRTEAYWRCSSVADARHSADWRKISEHQNDPNASAF